MRLILNLRGTNVIDLELHWPRREQPEQSSDQAGLEATSGGSFERADQYGDPATQMGFGFTANADA